MEKEKKKISRLERWAEANSDVVDEFINHPEVVEWLRESIRQIEQEEGRR